MNQTALDKAINPPVRLNRKPRLTGTSSLVGEDRLFSNYLTPIRRKQNLNSGLNGYQKKVAVFPFIDVHSVAGIQQA